MTETKTETKNAVITTNDMTEADNIALAVQEEANFDKLLKFRKGAYFIGNDTVPLGTEFLAHAVAWTKTWIKFVDGKVADRKLYRVARGEKPPDRDDLDDLDLIGKKTADNKSADPWVFQYLLPFENIETGEVLIFTTASIGGQQAVRELCDNFAKRIKNGQRGQPIIQLAVAEMPTKNFGMVQRPNFEIVGWDASGNATTPENLATAIPVKHTGKPPTNDNPLDDDIPF
jgi:hypothetical protein